MHIETRSINGKKKYYLTHSFRVGKKTKKIRKYLGLNLTKEDLEKKRNEIEVDLIKQVKKARLLRDPYLTVLSPKEINNLKSLEAKDTIIIKHLSEDEWKKFTDAFTYDTNAIEGSSVTEVEVEDILEKNDIPKYRSDWEISETYGVAKAIEYIRKTKEHISLDLLRKLHLLCFKDSKSFAGKFRAKGIEVGIVDGLGRVVHRGAPSTEVERLLKDLVKWYEENKNQYPPLVLAAVVHNQFENIHPFQDGNGRVGRLILNNILLRHSKPPVNIKFDNRQEYYAALRRYQSNGNIDLMIKLILKEYKNLKKNLKR